MFSRISTYLCGHDAITMEDLKYAIKESYNPTPLVAEITAVAQFKQMVDGCDILNSMRGKN